MVHASERAVFRAGARIGQHHLLEPLADGGMGSVWAAVTRGAYGFERLVAVKTLLPELVAESDYARALGDEARLSAQLTHRNSCEVLDAGLAEGHPFVVMEWVEGGSVADLLGRATVPAERRRLLPWAVAALWVQAAAGLQALHETRDEQGSLLHAVHRDVSSQNLLVSCDGYVKVVDLGIAKARGQRRARTRSGQMRGKLGYVAPEQILGESVSPRTDVFGLACVVYECVTGELPFRPHIDGFQDVLDERYVPPAQRVHDLPPQLDQLIRRCLSADAQRRPGSMQELREVLEGFLLDAGVDPVTVLRALLAARLPEGLVQRNRRIRAALFRRTSS